MANKGLFRDYYLDHRLDADLHRYYPDSSAAHAAFKEIKALWYSKKGGLAESEDNVTDLVKRMCEILGMEHSGQTKAKSAGDTSQRIDLTLFATPEARDHFTKAKGSKKDPSARYVEALAVVEVEQLGKTLETGKNDNTNPSQQIVNYLAYTKLPWGILTDGVRWRLYRRFDPSDRTRYLEIDLQQIIDADDEAGFGRWFYPFFSRAAFGGSFLDAVWAGSERYAVEIQESLREQAFAVVESLARGIYAAGGKTELDLLYEQAIVILYRLLFIKFAEDRDILPPDTATLQQREAYQKAYGFRNLQDEILAKLDASVPFSDHSAATTLWSRLNDVFKALDQGRADIGIPAYDGSLFNLARLSGVTVTDGHLARAIDRLSRLMTRESTKAKVDYRELGVRHLGSIYEGLLDYQLEQSGDSVRLVRAGSGSERKTTGSYYTPDYIVDYIVVQTLDPLCEGKSSAEIEQLKIIDMAMGSGHFLVTALSYLAQYHAWAIKREQNPYPPGQTFVEWAAQHQPDLDDIARSQRLLVGRCIYGVDLNPLAVELAKLALWLSTLSADRPLHFLDHHLRAGNSLVGSWLADLRPSQPKKVKKKAEAQPPLFDEQALSQDMHDALTSLGQIESEGQQAKVDRQQELYRQLRTELDSKYGRLADLVTATRFGLTLNKADQLKELADHLTKAAIATPPQFAKWLAEANQIARDTRFFHWQLQFPDVFFNEQGHEKAEAGFDAVVSNPPYVRQETLDESFKSYLRRYTTYASTADLYTYFIEQAHHLLKPGGRFGVICSNKFMRANYGQALRNFLAVNFPPAQIVDLAGLPVFPDATVRTIVMITTKHKVKEFTYVAPVSLDEFNSIHDGQDLVDLVQQKSVQLSAARLSASSWSFSGQELWNVLQRLSGRSVPLKKYVNNQIYFGIKTALNDAFIIDAATRKNLVEQDNKSAALIKPILIGRDVRRYYAPRVDRYLILLPSGWTRQTSNDAPDPWSWLQTNYSAIANHLAPFAEAARKRQDKGEYWWELRPCDYYAEFEKAKIIYPDIATTCRFALDREGQLGANTTYFIPNDDLYLLALLNSRLAQAYFQEVCAGLEGGGTIYLRFFGQYLQDFPVRQIEFTTPAAVREAMKGEAEALCVAGNTKAVLDWVDSRLKTLPEQADVIRDLLAYLAQQMVDLTRQRQQERAGFLAWLESLIKTPVESLRRKAFVLDYDEHNFEHLLQVLKDNAKTLEQVKPTSRTFMETLKTEYEQSMAKLNPLAAQTAITDRLIDQIVYRLYNLTDKEITTIET